MERVSSSVIASYENWVKNLNRNTKLPGDSKIKPKSPSSLLQEKGKKVERDKKLTKSELWIG